jgi:excisionase family DNA binding protein
MQTITNGGGASLTPIAQERMIAQPGLTVAQLAKRYRVSPSKVRGWIERGELPAINTANRRCARPRYVVTMEAVAAFERGRQAAAPETPKPKRRRKPANLIDFFPD